MECKMIERKQLDNGFEYLEIKNEFCEAKIALQGAHIYHYQRTNETPILWLSEVSDFELGKAIRGGVPLCWPWFGMLQENPSLPQHGFARTSIFELESTEELSEKSTKVTLMLRDSKESLEIWNHHFELRIEFILSDTLTIGLSTKNVDNELFTITQALHSYFQVSDIEDVVIEGLDNKPYFDALNAKECQQEGSISFMQEVDRVYQEVKDEIILKDALRKISINNQGSNSVVVWNPWIEKTKRMSAMSEDAYKSMVCIESANAQEDERVLKSGDSHTLSAVIT